MNNVTKLETKPAKRRRRRRKARLTGAAAYVPGDKLVMLIIRSLNGAQRVRLFRALVRIAKVNG